MSLNAQSSKVDEEIYSTYTSELNLSKEQSKLFFKILKKYQPLLNKKGIDNATFNKNNKLRDLAVYNLVDTEQFNLYKKVKLKLEPNYRYR